MAIEPGDQFDELGLGEVQRLPAPNPPRHPVITKLIAVVTIILVVLVIGLAVVWGVLNFASRLFPGDPL